MPWVEEYDFFNASDCPVGNRNFNMKNNAQQIVRSWKVSPYVNINNNYVINSSGLLCLSSC